MSDNKQAALRLGTRPIGELLMQYAIPAIIAMTASSLYNMVDSIFIGQGVGPMAISGLAITFPLMNLSAAFGAAVGVGASTFISVKLGQKDYKTVLQEILQVHGDVKIEYTIIKETGPDHNKSFEAEVSLNGKILAKGKGKSKKEAEMQAAKKALEKRVEK